MKKGIKSFVFAIIMPYLFFAIVIFILSKHELLNGFLFVLLLLLAVGIGIGSVIACVLCNVTALTTPDEYGSTLRYFILKLAHLPAHLLILGCVCGFLNPWLMWFTWLPILSGISLLVYDGCTNICTCIMLLKNGKCNFSTALLLIIAGFVYVLDYVGVIAQGKIARKNTQNYY